jgi:hypothetical protein
MPRLKYDQLSLYMFNLSHHIKFLSNKFNAYDLFEDRIISDNLLIYILFYNYIKNIIKIKNKNNTLMITNMEETIKSLKKINMNCNILLFKNEEYSFNDKEYNETFKNIQNQYLNDPIINNIDIYDEKIKKTENKKYNTIIIKINEFLKSHYISFFSLTKLPNLISSITNSLIRLEKNGNLFIFIGTPFINNTFKKIIYLLENLFSKIELIKNKSKSNINLHILYCSGYMNKPESLNIYDQNIDKLIDISLKSHKYNYNSSQIMHYFYHYSKQNSNNSLMYNLDVSKFPTNFESKQKTMKILDDIDIKINESLRANYILYEIDNLYIDYFNKINYNILKNTYIDKNIFYIDNDFINKMQYTHLSNLIPILNENKIPYNKAYLAYLDKYNINQINQLHSLENTINFLLTKTNSFIQSKNNFNKLKITKSYYYDELNEFQDIYQLAIKTNDLTLTNHKLSNKVPFVVKSITDNYSRGVARYINNSKKYKLAFEISNGFTKMWEMLSSFNLLSNQKDKPLNVFFIAEAPGQWIYSLDYYIKKKLDNVKKWDWRATSLNPKHPVNLEKFGKGILDDAYGFIKHYPKNWLWGVDETGDITNSANIKWYHQYVKEWEKPNLVTGDAGIQSSSPVIYQKLELAQVLMVAAVSQKGGNCIIKHFLPYIPEIEETKEANGFFMNYIYLYYLMFEEVYMIKPLSSNPVSGEFYVIGKKFIGLDNMILDNLINLLDNFEVNMCFFKKEDIPEHFVKQVFGFIEKLTNLNVDFIEIQNTLLTCLYKRDAVIEKVTQCRKYLNPKYMEEIQEAKFKKWIDIYAFF